MGSSPQDTKLAVLVIRDRLLTPAQLDECRLIQKNLEARQNPRSLAQIIVARHYASADQLRDLVAKEITRRTTAPRPAATLGPDLEREDAELARKLTARGVLDEARVQECLALTRRAREQKPDVRFAQIVLKKGYATREALKSVLEVLPPLTGRYGLPPTQMRPAFDASALGGSSSASGRPIRPTGTPPNAAPRGTSASWTPVDPPSQTVGPLFDAPAAGPQPLFGEASGVVRPMFGYEGSSASRGALPFRGSSARLASMPGPPSRGTSAARPVAQGFFDQVPPQPPAPQPTQPQPAQPQRGQAPPQGQAPATPRPPVMEPFLPSTLLDPWSANQQPQPWPVDARGNYKTVELDPRDPAIPQRSPGALPFSPEYTESPTARPFQDGDAPGTSDPVGGDPFGEGRVSSKEFNAFDSLRATAPQRAPQPPPAAPPSSARPGPPPPSSARPFDDFVPLDESRAPGEPRPPAGPGIPDTFSFDRPFETPAPFPSGSLFARDPFSGDEPIGLGKGSSGVAALDGAVPGASESWGTRAAPAFGFAMPEAGQGARPSDGFGPPPELGFGPPIDLGSAPDSGSGGGDLFRRTGQSDDPGRPSDADLPADELGLAGLVGAAERRETAASQGPGLPLDLPSDAPTDPDSADAHKKAPNNKKKTGVRPARGRAAADGAEADGGAERPRRSPLRWIVLAFVLLALGGGGFATWRIVTDRMAVNEAERVFLDAHKAPVKERDPRKALALGEALPDRSKLKTDIREALASLRTEVGVLDARDEARKIVESLDEQTPPQDRLDLSEKAMHKDPTNARAFLEHARARIALGSQRGAKALAIARTAAATEDLPFAQGLDPNLLEAHWELANLQELSGPGRDQMKGQLEKIKDADREGVLGLLAAGRLRALARNDPKAVTDALDLFSRAVEAKPDSPLPHLIRGRYRLATNHFEGAFRDGDEAVRLTNRKSAEALTLLAWARREEKGDLTGCKRDLEDAIALDKSWAPAFGQRALLRWQQGDVKGADDDARSALQIDEGEPSALLAQAAMSALTKPNSVSFVTDTRRLNEARRLLRVATERDDHLVPAILLYGRLAMKDADIDTALRSFNRVLELDPQNAPALGNRGNIYIQQRKLSEARSDLDKAIEIDPRNERALFIRGRLRTDNDPRDYDGAIADLTKAVSIEPEYAEAYLYRGIAYFGNGRMNEAVEDETTALKKGDKNFNTQYRHDALYIRGMAHFTHKDWKEAVDDLSSAKTAAPAGAVFLGKVDGYINTAKENLAKDGQPPEK